MIDGELIDARRGLVDTGGVDRKDGVDVAGDAGRRDQRLAASPASRWRGSDAGVGARRASVALASGNGVRSRYASSRRCRTAVGQRHAQRLARRESSACAVTAAKSSRGCVGALHQTLQPACIRVAWCARVAKAAAPWPGKSCSASCRHRLHVEQGSVGVEHECIDPMCVVGIYNHRRALRGEFREHAMQKLARCCVITRNARQKNRGYTCV